MNATVPRADTPEAPAWARSTVIAVACAALVVTLSMGVRQSFGLLMQPIGRELGLSREAFALTIAAQNLLFGLVQPFVGAVADRYGPRATLVIGTLAYVAGLAIAAAATNLFGIALGLGFLTGLALSGTTFIVVLGAVGKLVPAAHRTTAFGIVTAGGSLGQFAVVPLAQLLIDQYGWRGMLVGSALLVVVIAVAAWGIGRPEAGRDASAPQRVGDALTAARGSGNYWLLNGGFFVCGFQLAFIGTHLPAYLVDRGLAAQVGAWALALVGLFNILGSYCFGRLGQARSRPLVLAALYAARAVAIAIFLAAPISPLTALAFAAAMGFLWLGTVPLTNGAVASMFGVANLSMLTGIVFMSHQVGAFFGAWLGGLLYDRTGSYDLVWHASIALGVLAAALSAMTKDGPVPFAPAAVLR